MLKGRVDVAPIGGIRMPRPKTAGRDGFRTKVPKPWRNVLCYLTRENPIPPRFSQFSGPERAALDDARHRLRAVRARGGAIDSSDAGAMRSVGRFGNQSPHDCSWLCRNG